MLAKIHARFSPMARFHDLLRSAGWREFVLLLAVAVICGSILIFVGVTDVVREGELHETEIRWMRALRSAEDPSRPIGPLWLERWSRDITALGSGAVLTLMTLLVAGYLLIDRGYASAVLLLVSVGGGTLLTAGLKGFFERDRPKCRSTSDGRFLQELSERAFHDVLGCLSDCGGASRAHDDSGDG